MNDQDGVVLMTYGPMQGDADPKMMQKLLLRAADIMEVGWCRYSLCVRSFDKDPLHGVVGVDSFCMQGAIMKARFEMYGEANDSTEAALAMDGAYREVQRLLPEFEDSRGVLMKPSIPFFNDKLCADGQHAADLFRQAAEGLA